MWENELDSSRNQGTTNLSQLNPSLYSFGKVYYPFNNHKEKCFDISLGSLGFRM